MNPEEFQSYVASGRLTQIQVKKLLSLAPGTFCLHRSWGFGKVASFDMVLGQIVIDFTQKPQHPMQFAYAADSLQVLPEDHILAQKANHLEDLKKNAEENPAQVVRDFAKSFGEA